MVRQPVCIIVLLLGFVGGVAAQSAQEFSFRTASRIGLASAWSRAISTGTAGHVAHVTVQPSTTSTYRASEVIDKNGRRVFFSDRDASGGLSRAGYDQTARLTDIKRAELEARGLEPRVESKEIADVTLYVRSSLGTVTAIDGETGRELWTTQAGKAGYPNYPVSATQDHLVTMSGSTIYVLDPAKGEIVDSIRTRKAPGNAPTLYDGYIYVPTTQGLVEVYSLENTGRVDFTMGSSGRIENTVTVSPNSVSWTTDRGFVYVGNVGAPGIRYRFKSLDAITSAPVYMDDTLYATSMDGFTYAINESDGLKNWSYSAGGSTSGAPLALDGAVYVATTEGRMSCLDAATGEPRWLTTGVTEFVSVSKDRVYCTTSGSQLTAFDKRTGKMLGSTPIPSDARPVLNTTTDRLYLVSGRGILYSLRETGSRWPTVRMPPVKETQEDKKKKPLVEPPPSDSTIDMQEDVPSTDEPDESDPFVDFGDAQPVEEDMPAEGDGEDPFEGDDPFGDTEDTGDDAGDSSDPFADFE